MQIDGHEVERRGTRHIFINGKSSGWIADDPDDYDKRARDHERNAERFRLLAEFVRREAAEKAAADAATELDRRAKIVLEAWFGSVSRTFEEAADEVVRALDADAAEREA
jgi:hypothetical protein